MIFKNNNGNAYLILDRHNDIMLLAQLDNKKFVVAVGVSDSSWASGNYYSDVYAAVDCFKKVIN